jgi:hypothetical protein
MEGQCSKAPICHFQVLGPNFHRRWKGTIRYQPQPGQQELRHFAQAILQTVKEEYPRDYAKLPDDSLALYVLKDPASGRQVEKIGYSSFRRYLKLVSRHTKFADVWDEETQLKDVERWGHQCFAVLRKFARFQSVSKP